MIMLDAERAGRVQLAGRGHLLLLLRCETVDLALEIGLLDSRCAQGCVQVFGDLIIALRDAANVLDVPLVPGVLAARRATAHAHDE
jgi:hypothetical protein